MDERVCVHIVYIQRNSEKIFRKKDETTRDKSKLRRVKNLPW